MKPRKIVRTLALLLFSGLFLFAGCRIVSYYGETRAQEAAFGTLQEMVAKGTSATVHSAEESQIPMPSGGGDNGKYLRVNAGGGFDLVSPDFFTKAETLKDGKAD